MSKMSVGICSTRSWGGNSFRISGQGWGEVIAADTSSPSSTASNYKNIIVSFIPIFFSQNPLILEPCCFSSSHFLSASTTIRKYQPFLNMYLSKTQTWYVPTKTQSQITLCYTSHLLSAYISLQILVTFHFSTSLLGVHLTTNHMETCYHGHDEHK